MRSNEWAIAPAMNEARSAHSQCALGDSLFAFFGCIKRDGREIKVNSIERINATEVIDRISTKWALIELQSQIQPRYDTLACQIDDNEIAILGGYDGSNYLGEVLLFNT